MWSIEKTTVVKGLLFGFVSSFFSFGVAFAAPIIDTFEPNETVVTIGSSITISWNATDATGCTASNAWSGAKIISNSEVTGALTEGIHTFALECTDGTTTDTKSFNVVVADPPSLTYSAATEEIEYNTPATLSWSSTNADSCETYGDWSMAIGTSSAGYTTENLISNKDYGIRCTGPGGTVEEVITIKIVSSSKQVELDFDADDPFIDYEGSTTIRWTVIDADWCTASGDWGGGKNNISGSYNTGVLSATKNYSLTCGNSDGSQQTINVTVTVASRPVLPIGITFWADDTSIDYDHKAKLRWTSTNADYCKALSPTSGGWVGILGTSGDKRTAKLVSNQVFTIKCYGYLANKTATVSIIVAPNPVEAPAMSFDADSTGIEYDTATDLNWNVTGSGISSIVASGDWTGAKSDSGTESTGDIVSDKTYKLRAINSGGTTDGIVNVAVAAPTFKPPVSISIDTSILAYNEETVVRWTSSDADSCSLSWSGGGTGSTSVAANDSFATGKLIEDRTYQIACTNAAGTNTAVVAALVIPAGNLPTVNLNADDNPVAYNTGTTIRWTTSDAVACAFSDAPGTDVGTSGARNTGNLILPQTYVLVCAGPGGVGSDTVTITIQGTPGGVPTLSFWADDYAFYGSGTTTLHWTTVDADWCTASGAWSGAKPVANSGERTQSTGEITSTKTYNIECGNVNGSSTGTLTLTVDTELPVEVEYSVDQADILKNSNVNIIWNAKNANWCQSYSSPIISGWERYANQTAGAEDTKNIGPFGSYETVLYLNCGNHSGSTGWFWDDGTSHSPIVIHAGDPLPQIYITAPAMVAYNTPAAITWDATYADSCEVFSQKSDPAWNGARLTSGVQLSSNLTIWDRFYIRCTGSGGTSGWYNRFVNVAGSVGDPPEITFASDKYSLTEAEVYNVTWTATNATSCVASSTPNGVWSGGKDATGGTEAITFSGDEQDLVLTCSNLNGSVSSIIKTLKAGTGTSAPNVSLWVDNMSLPAGGNTTIRWMTENATSCIASNGWSGAKAAGGGNESTGPLAATTRFELTCANAFGSTVAITDVAVGVGALPVTFTSFEPRGGDWDIAAGESITLDWATVNATSCIATDLNNGQFVGAVAANGSQTLTPSVTTTYRLMCSNSGSSATSTPITIIVAKLLVCPSPARIIGEGNSLSLRAWFKQDADAGFSCSDPNSGGVNAIDVINGTAGFNADWSSANDTVVELTAPGVVLGNLFTESNGGPVDVSIEYKEMTASTQVIVSPPPITCWKCSESKTCYSEITFPLSGDCPSDASDSLHDCAKSCRKPVDWQETGT